MEEYTPTHPKNLPARGVVVIANGPESVQRATILERTLSHLSPQTPVVLLKDAARPGYLSRAYKTNLPWLSPFEDTLFLDSDIVVLGCFNEIWDLLDEHDLWMARDIVPTVGRALQAPIQRADEEERDLTQKVCAAEQPYFNSGVILFRRTERVKGFFHAWDVEWCRYMGVDQFALSRALVTLNTSPATLPMKFNYPLRLCKRGGLVRPVFLHCWGIKSGSYTSISDALIRSYASFRSGHVG